MHQVGDQLSVIKSYTHLTALREVEARLGYLVVSQVIDCGHPTCLNYININNAHGYRFVGDEIIVDGHNGRHWCGNQMDIKLKPKGILTKPKQFKLPHHV